MSKYLRIPLILITIIGIITLILMLRKENIEKRETEQKLMSQKTDCVEIKNLRVEWNSMSPLIENGSIVQTYMNYYQCTSEVPKHGDIVIIEDSAFDWPFIKTVAAIPWDVISFTVSGTLLRGRTELKNKNNEVYLFTKEEINFLSIYIQDGKIKRDAYFVFWENMHHSRDSKKIGAVSLGSLKAKVMKINEEEISQTEASR
jgi:signal peptidase I